MNRNRGRGSTPNHRSRGRSSPSTHSPPANTKPMPVGTDVLSDEAHLEGMGNKSQIHEHTSGGSSTKKIPKQFNEAVPFGSGSIDIGKLKLVPDPPVEALNRSKHLDGQPGSKFANDHQLSTQSDQMVNDLNLRECQLSKAVTSATSQVKTIGPEKPFDICQVKTGPLKLKPSLHKQNREKRNEITRSMGGQAANTLRPGMVLLKNFISCNEQVKIVRTCRKLGRGNGGFYQPAYEDGAKMHLNMMCLGKNWDPKTSSYGERRPVDDAEPPPIPSEFHQLVEKAIQVTHAHLLTEDKQKEVESVLPSMKPDICIVNFYTSNGKLGLHQDKDETEESLYKGLPVVSISIGDSAKFLYGDQRDVDTAEKVVLESGDVLIFGGKSRHVYHGVTDILPKTAPHALLEESDLRKGRLNLTFRKY